MRTSVFRNLNADFFPICLTVPNTRYSFLICVEKHRMLYLFFPISCFCAPCFVSCFLAWITRLEKAGSAEMSLDPCSLFSGFPSFWWMRWNQSGTVVEQGTNPASKSVNRMLRQGTESPEFARLFIQHFARHFRIFHISSTLFSRLENDSVPLHIKCTILTPDFLRSKKRNHLPGLDLYIWNSLLNPDPVLASFMLIFRKSLAVRVRGKPLVVRLLLATYLNFPHFVFPFRGASCQLLPRFCHE